MCFVPEPVAFTALERETTGLPQGRDCGAAEIQRIAENAPRWSDMNRQTACAVLLNMAVEPLACAILVWPEAFEGAG
jgi:hypothetical protein